MPVPNAVLMVESEAAILSEEVMLGAVVYGHEQMQTVINAINEIRCRRRYQALGTGDAPAVNENAETPKLPSWPQLNQVKPTITEKAVRYETIAAIKGRVESEQVIASGVEEDAKKIRWRRVPQPGEPHRPWSRRTW